MILPLTVLSIAIAAASLGWGYAMRGIETGAWMATAGAALWLVGLWQRWRWIDSVGLVGAVLLAAAGILLGLSGAWMFAGALFALVAWDLTDFRRRLANSLLKDDLGGMERRHLLRMSMLMIAALGLTSVAMAVRVTLGFEWILLLVIALAIGLANFLRWLRGPRAGTS